MIDFWNGIHTPDGAIWFNQFTNEYEFEKRPDGFDAYIVGMRSYKRMIQNMMPKFDINDIVTVPYDHDKKYWTVTAVRTNQIKMRATYDLVSAKTGITLDNVPEVDMTFVKRPTQKKEKSDMDNRYMVKKLIYHGPATIVYWADGEKTVVKCMDADTFDPMAGFCAALAKKEASNEANCEMRSDCPHSGIGCGSCGNSSSYGEVYHESREDTFSKPD